MPDTVKIGNVNVPKPALFIGVAAAGGILFYAYYMRGGTGGSVDAETTVPDDSGIDPYTGLPYSDQFGFGSGGYSGVGIYDPSTGGTIGGGYGGGIVTGVTTNAAWSQAVINYFETHGTYAETNVSNALGKVLTGRPITVDELNIFNAARAVQGEPPQAYPTIQMVSAAPGGTTNPSGSSLPAPTGLKATATGRGSIRVDWNPVKGAKGYALYQAADGAGGGTPTGARRTSTVYSVYTFSGLKPGTRYRFDIHPLGMDDKIGARGRTYATTKR